MVIPINTRTLESVDYTGGISDTDKTTHLSGSTDMPDADAENLQALLAELGLPDLPVSSSALFPKCTPYGNSSRNSLYLLFLSTIMIG